MSQIAIYLDKEIQEEMDDAAKMAGKSRSAWVKEAIIHKIQEKKLPDDWFKLWGSWEDNRSIPEILHDIDSGYSEQEREPIK